MGTFTETDALTAAYRTLRDTADVEAQQLVTTDELTQFLRQAERRYSLDRPRMIATDVAADGTLTTALPAGFAEGERIVSIEWPANQNPPALVDPRSYRFYLDPTTGLRLRWLDGAPATGAVVRFTYTGSRGYNAVAASTTVLDRDHFSVCDLACSYAAQSIAAKYARTHEPLINADSASYRTKQQEWTDLAKRWFSSYRDGVGLGSAAGDGTGTTASRPAGGFANWDGQSSIGSDFIWHRRANR